MNSERAYQVLLSPHVSEKATANAETSNRHIFRVAVDATKREIKIAVEKLFSVSVDSVNVINVKGKNKRFGAIQGRRKNWKKAIVALQAGNDIDFTGSER